MLGFLFNFVPMTVMTAAFIAALKFGVMAGESGNAEGLGFGAMAICIVLFLAQAALWALWGLNLGGGIA